MLYLLCHLHHSDAHGGQTDRQAAYLLQTGGVQLSLVDDLDGDLQEEMTQKHPDDVMKLRSGLYCLSAGGHLYQEATPDNYSNIWRSTSCKHVTETCETCESCSDTFNHLYLTNIITAICH